MSPGNAILLGRISPRRLKRLLFVLTLLASLFAACNDNPPAPSPTPAFVDRPVVEINDGRCLEPEDSEWDGYGQAVDVRGDLMVVGASDWNTDGAGSAYVYRFSESEQTWQEEARLLPSGEDGRRMRHLFGAAVAIGDGVIAVGAPGADDPVYGANTGAVYVFEHLDGRWTETAKLRSNRPDGNGGQEPLAWLRRGRLRPRAFGAILALQGNTLAVGGEASTATVYVYRRDEQGWQEQARITTPTLPETDLYMSSLALAGDTLALSALHMPPDQSEVAPFIRGNVAVYLFQRADDNTWQEQF
ncbi:MAG: FG-GAP repeat protein, partial [Chloroflexota bacterium]